MAEENEQETGQDGGQGQPTFTPEMLDQKIAEALEAHAKNSVQQQSSTQESSQGQQSQSQSNNKDVLDAINAQPERIVNALREAFQKPSDSTKETQEEKKTENSGSEQQSPGRRRSFKEWWFGSEAV